MALGSVSQPGNEIKCVQETHFCEVVNQIQIKGIAEFELVFRFLMRKLFILEIKESR